MNIVIIKYNAGNIHSVRLALERLGIKPKVSDDPLEILKADKIIFPGVGEARSAKLYLKDNKLDELIVQLKQPVLGICLGLQLMCAHSEENDTDCFNIFPAKVKRFPPQDKVPHMGWNTLTNLEGPLFHGVKENSYAYFVHSYYAEQSPDAIAQTNYIIPFSSALQNDNFFAVQFHPEKSAAVGEQILKNFIELQM